MSLLTILKRNKLLAADNFNRPDSSSLGNADTGQPWQVSNTTWSIVSGMAKQTSATGTIFAYIDSKRSDRIAISADIKINSNDGIAFRLQNTTNYLLARYSATDLGLYTVINGTATNLGLYSLSNPDGTVRKLRIELVGASIKVFNDGNLVISANSSFNQSFTNHGFRSVNSLGSYDNFRVEAL